MTGRASRVLKTLVLALSFATGMASAQESSLTVKRLRSEYKVDPLGIDVAKPRLSWELLSGEKNVLQTAYELQVSLSERDLDREKDFWESGMVNSDASVGMEYAGPPLVTERTYFWRVRVWDNHGHASPWSAPAKWEMALLDPADWKASWITPNLGQEETKANPAPLLRKEFVV